MFQAQLLLTWHAAYTSISWRGYSAWQEELFIKFAEFEEKVKEIERARAIYKYALDHIPKSQADTVYQRFVAFEKQHGDREGIEVRDWKLLCSLGLKNADVHPSAP
jgi:hypothetical protein